MASTKSWRWFCGIVLILLDNVNSNINIPPEKIWVSFSKYCLHNPILKFDFDFIFGYTFQMIISRELLTSWVFVYSEYRIVGSTFTRIWFTATCHMPPTCILHWKPGYRGNHRFTSGYFLSKLIIFEKYEHTKYFLKMKESISEALLGRKMTAQCSYI